MSSTKNRPGKPVGIVTSRDLAGEKPALVEELEIDRTEYSIISPNALAPERVEEVDCLFFLADDYPNITKFNPDLTVTLQAFEAAGKRVFLEFSVHNNYFTNNVTRAEYLRIIAREDATDPLVLGIAPNTLLEPHQVYFLAPSNQTAEVESFSLGRVAGVQTAIFGLPKTTYPAIIRSKNLVISSFKLSDYERMEFRPFGKWRQLIRNLISFVTGRNFGSPPPKQPSTTTRGAKIPHQEHLAQEKLREIYRDTILRGISWYQESGIMPDSKGTREVYEGFTSAFDEQGRKNIPHNYYLPERPSTRADCTIESAFAFWCAGKALENPEFLAISDNLFHAGMHWQHCVGNGVQRGFWGWYNDPYDEFVFYADDNGRCTVPVFYYGILKQDLDVIRRGIAACEALYRTHGKNGHRWARIDLKHFYQKKGRKKFRKKIGRRSYKSPHYEAYAFTTLLLGYYLTRDDRYLEVAQRGIEDYIAQYPHIELEMSMNDDLSNLLIAATFLFKITGRKEHGEFVETLVQFFGDLQDPTWGGIRETDPYNLRRRAEPSNEKYGRGEASLWTTPDDQITDQLYATGFMALGLYCAKQAGIGGKTQEVLDRLLEYICAIQIVSSNPQLDGGWMRSFDLTLGEYFGANGDVGWGAYSMETGWMISLNITALAWVLLEFDPWPEIAEDLWKKIGEIHEKEVYEHDRVENEWRAHTPKAPIPPKR